MSFDATWSPRSGGSRPASRAAGSWAATPGARWWAATSAARKDAVIARGSLGLPTASASWPSTWGCCGARANGWTATRRSSRSFAGRYARSGSARPPRAGRTRRPSRATSLRCGAGDEPRDDRLVRRRRLAGFGALVERHHPLEAELDAAMRSAPEGCVDSHGGGAPLTALLIFSHSVMPASGL